MEGKKGIVTKERAVCFVLGGLAVWAVSFTARVVRGYQLAKRLDSAPPASAETRAA